LTQFRLIYRSDLLIPDLLIPKRACTRGRILQAVCKISIQLSAQRAMKRNPPGTSLESLDKENARAGVYIAHAQAKRFTKTEARAVEDEQRPVELCPKRRAAQTGAECQQFQNVLFGKKIRDEGGLGRQLRPERFHNAPVGRSAQVGKELPENRCIAGHAHRLALRFARQPLNCCPVELPTPILGGIVSKEPVELAQRKLRPSISIPQAPLELEKTVQLAGNRAVKDFVHRGAGSATPRRRVNATLT